MDRATRRLMPALAIVLVLAGLVAPAATAAPKGGPKPPSSGVKVYSATVSPPVTPVAPVPSGAQVLLTLTNGPSNVGFGSAEVSFEGENRFEPPFSVDRAGWVVAEVSAPGATTTVLRLTNGGSGGQYEVTPGSSVTVTLPVRPTAGAGQVELRSQVKQSNDFSGTGNDFQGGTAPVAYFGAGPAHSIEWVTPPSTVQIATAPSGVATAGLTPTLVMCPTVRVVDEDGNPVTDTQVSIAVTASGGGLTYTDGSVTQDLPVTRTTTAGVLRLGDAGCTEGVQGTSLGTGLTMTARATVAGMLRQITGPFDVLPVYGTCAGATCSASGVQGEAKTTASVAASGGGTGSQRLTFYALDSEAWAFPNSSCDPDPGTRGKNPYRDEVTVDLNGYAKTLTLRWGKKAVQWHTSNGAKSWQVCVATDYEWTALDGAATAYYDPAQVQTPVDLPEWYVGSAPPCPSDLSTATGPCLQSLGRNAGDQVATVHLPDVEGDPKAF